MIFFLKTYLDFLVFKGEATCLGSFTLSEICMCMSYFLIFDAASQLDFSPCFRGLYSIGSPAHKLWGLFSEVC